MRIQFPGGCLFPSFHAVLSYWLLIAICSLFTLTCILLNRPIIFQNYLQQKLIKTYNTRNTWKHEQEHQQQ